jgi:hypothetical protein
MIINKMSYPAMLDFRNLSRNPNGTQRRKPPAQKNGLHEPDTPGTISFIFKTTLIIPFLLEMELGSWACTLPLSYTFRTSHTNYLCMLYPHYLSHPTRLGYWQPKVIEYTV